jgi:hypothetical protein
VVDEPRDQLRRKQQQEPVNAGAANYNAVPFGGGGRPLPQYGDFQIFRHSSFQNYHGLQSLLSRQRGRFNFTFAYTLSKALGTLTGGAVSQGNAAVSEYQFDQRRSIYGVLRTDRTQVAAVSYSWLLPDWKAEGALNAIFGGWQIAGVSTYVSGGPLQHIEGGTSNFGLHGTLADGTEILPETINGSPDIPVQPVLTCDPRRHVPDGYLFNPSCFAPPQLGQLGNFIFPYIKDQAYHNHDLAVFKNVSLGTGAKKLQFRVSAYNVLNHPIAYPDPATNINMTFTEGKLDDPNGDFGRLPTDNKSGRRIVQLVVRLLF